MSFSEPRSVAPAGNGRRRILFELDKVRVRLGARTIPNEEGWSETLERGSRLAVLGRSGSGKTTLLHILGLLSPASAGAVRFFPRQGDPLTYSELYEPSHQPRLRRMRNERFGFVFQADHLLENLSTEHNLSLPLLLRGIDPDAARQRARELTDQFFEHEGVDSILARNPSDLSGGQRSRIALLRGVIADPEVLFLDEPFTYLDNRQVTRAVDWLWAWQRQAEAEAPRTIVIVTHDLHRAAELGTHFLVVAPDQTVFFASAEELGAIHDRLKWLLEILPNDKDTSQI